MVVVFCSVTRPMGKFEVTYLELFPKADGDPSPEPKVSLFNYLSKFTLSTTVTSASVDSK